MLNKVEATFTSSPEDQLFVNIVVQGFDDNVIRGFRQMIEPARACVIEIHVASPLGGQPSFRAIFLQMDELVFVFNGVLYQFRDKTGKLLYFNAVFVKFQV